MRRLSHILFFTTLFLSSLAFSQNKSEEIITQALIIKGPGGNAETILPCDPVELSLVRGTWRAPVAGDSIKYPADSVYSVWQAAGADSTGWFTQDQLGRAYVYASYIAESDETLLLQGMGNSLVYVNGTLRAGNPYGTSDEVSPWQPGFSFSFIPVTFHKGTNHLLFQCARGVLKIRLVKPRGPVVLNMRDVTSPDAILGSRLNSPAATVVINATNEAAAGLRLQAVLENGTIVGDTILPALPPLSVRKCGFRVSADVPSVGASMILRLRVFGTTKSGGASSDTGTMVLNIVAPDQVRKETFVSGIDGSVQYYAVNPSSSPAPSQSLFLSLHGANVEARGQAAAYSHKSWGTLIAPTNRRPFGFNWEDIGRLDALEVLELAQKEFRPDPARIYLTGHSMGGHGTYHLGVTYPDKFAAISPSAGWVSFWSYGKQDVPNPSALRSMLQKAALPSRTDTLVKNLATEGVYIVHGEADDNVPAAQAHGMVDKLRAFHKDFDYHFEPGAGHWWGRPHVNAASDCVDWVPMFEFLSRHSIPPDNQVRTIEYATANPGVSAKDHWAEITQQEHPLERSSIALYFNPLAETLSGTTANVHLLTIDVSAFRNGPGRPDSVAIVLDSQKVGKVALTSENGALRLEREAGLWHVGTGDMWQILSQKNPFRNGTFKDIYRNRVMFVYGTKGSPEENRWAYEKARFDAERLWYQGNAAVDVIADVDFNSEADHDRNVVLFGNSATNLAWKPLLGSGPVSVDKDRVRIGDKRFKGANLACLFIRPRPNSANASVACIGGTGIEGMKLTNRMAYLQPGVGFPDCTIADPNVLTVGDDAALLAGFFGNDWKVETGEWAKQPPE